MAEPSTHINYTFEDIQRYLQGKMPAAEMHALEKAALQDTFLADAIEGYTNADANVAQQHLKEINAGLFAEKQKNKVVAFNKRTQWLNVAALIVVLIGIGLISAFFLRSSSTGKQTEIAQVKQEAAKQESAKDTIAQTANVFVAKEDTLLLIAANKPVNKKIVSKAKKQIPVVENTGTLRADDGDISSTNSSAPVLENIQMSRSYVAAAPPKITDSIQPMLSGRAAGLNVLPVNFSGKVVDENNKPIAGVSIISADKKDAVLTDPNGYFNLLKTDTLLNVTASTVGYNSKSTALKQGLNKPIILKENNAALNEVAVVGYGTQRKRDIFGTDSIIRGLNKALPDSAMPVVGWNNFNHYVVTQLNKDTTSAAVTNPDDIVELEFLIDKIGNPYDITVTKSLNELHSQKAIEILKNGPKWSKPSKKKKTKVVISF